MKLISIESARITLLLGTAKIGKQARVSDVVSVLADAFQFVHVPSADAVDGGSLHLRQGIYSGAGFDMQLYSDGIVIESQSTSDIVEEISNVVREKLENTFDIRFYEYRSFAKLYESALITEASGDVFRFLDSLNGVCDFIGARLKEKNNIDTAYSVFGCSLAEKEFPPSGARPSIFRIERRAGAEPSRNQYFSVAPLSTEDHLELLENFEAIC